MAERGRGSSTTSLPSPRLKQRRAVAQPTVNEYKGYLPRDCEDVAARESVEDLNRENVWQRYISCRRPVVIDGLVKDEGWEGERWKDLSFLRKIAGSTLVKIEPVDEVKGQFGTGSKRKNVQLSTFLDMLEDPEQAGKWYMTTQYEDEDEDEEEMVGGEEGESYSMQGKDRDAVHIDERLLPKMDVDVSLPPPTNSLAHLFPLPGAEIMGDLVLQQCNLWMGNGKSGKSSGLHHDFHDNLYMLLSGRKRFLIWPPLAHPWLEPVGKIQTVHCNGLIEYDMPHQAPLRPDGLTSRESSMWLYRARLRALLEADERAARQTGEEHVIKGSRKGKGKQTEDQERALRLLKEAEVELKLLQMHEEEEEEESDGLSTSSSMASWGKWFERESDSEDAESSSRGSDEGEDEDGDELQSESLHRLGSINGERPGSGKRAPESSEEDLLNEDERADCGTTQCKRQKRSSSRLVVPTGGLPGGLRGSLEDLEGHLTNSSDEYADEDEEPNEFYIYEPDEGEVDREEEMMMTLEMRSQMMARRRAAEEGSPTADSHDEPGEGVDDEDEDDEGDEEGSEGAGEETDGAPNGLHSLAGDELDSEPDSEGSWPAMDAEALEAGEEALEELARMQSAREGSRPAVPMGPSDEPKSFSRIHPRAMQWYFKKPFDPAVHVAPQLEPAANNEVYLLPRQGCPPPIEIHLHAGQMLYLPASWYHEVTSYTDPEEKSGVHMALNYWFHPPTMVRRPSQVPIQARSGSTAKFSASDSSRPYRDAEVWNEIRRCVNAKVDAIRRRAAIAAVTASTTQ